MATVTVGAGQTYTTITAAVAANPAGTIYDVLAGTYTATVTPKAGDVYLGRPGAILDGGSSGTSKRAFAGSSVNNVTVDGFEIKNWTDDSNTNLHTGVFDTGVWRNNSGWVIRNCDLHNNTGCAIATHNNLSIIDCKIHDNQYYGIRGTTDADNVMVDNCDIYNNNTAQSSPYGGTAFASGNKFYQATNHTVQNCRIYSNYGFGLWFDTNCTGIVIDNNVIHDNLPIPGAPSFQPSGGIFWEIPIATGTSADNRITNNNIYNNGEAIWLYSAGNIEIYGNNIHDNTTRGVYIYNDGTRGSDPQGTQYLCRNINMHDNRIATPSTIPAVEATDVNGAPAWTTLNNILVLNTYFSSNASTDFKNISTNMNFTSWQAAGHDLTSTITNNGGTLPSETSISATIKNNTDLKRRNFKDGRPTGSITAKDIRDMVESVPRLASGPINSQTGTSYTLTAADHRAVVLCANAAAITVTVPTGLPRGFECTVLQGGVGQVTIAEAAGIAIFNRQSQVKTAGRWARVTLSPLGANVYVLAGDTGT